MQPTAYPIRTELLEQAWQSFIDTGQVDESMQDWLDPAILRSWLRCAPRLDPWAKPRLTNLKVEALQRVLVTHFDLIAIARPIMEDIHQFAEESNSAVLLTDGTACILDVLGDHLMVDTAGRLGLRAGVYWNEGGAGTNALALALLEAVPVQVVGSEHYFRGFHDLTCSAAPIHDVNGRIVGALAMAGHRKDAHPHTLAGIMAGARAITNQLQTDMYLQEANRHLGELNAVFRAISDGVMSWNRSGSITHINDQAGEILNLKPQTVLGRPLEEVLQIPAVLLDAIQNGQSVRDVEARFVVDDHTANCLVSLRPIREGPQEPVGYIVTLRPIERVRQLVHRLIGSQATLTLEDMLGESAVMRHVRREARIAAQGTAPVLLQGEDGVSKNPLARAIHNESNRAAGPFLAMNCQAIPHELMVSEFLGYEGGAFSGVLAEGRPSKFELADGGTLFLDEVDSLTQELQAALLQVIDTGHVMRLGGTRPIPIALRIIAATSADLEQRVAEGSFRSDLYYRFGVFSIVVPPLRERVEDIPLLVERFLARITKQMNRPARIDDDALALLMRYPWPGNVRELETVLVRAVALGEDGDVHVEDLPAVVRNGRILTPESPVPEPVLTLAEAEREAIIRVGWACQGQVTSMADQLGISRTTLWRKMKRLNLGPKDFRRQNRIK
ncbi:MAG: dihydroxyacetone kinase operon transcriptional regulator DhaR [Anaerolineae bacterium]